ncbi:PAS domain S-box protein [Methanolobus vulcani]|nr:PAS domain S-box protein [Methanolobus vulcani]
MRSNLKNNKHKWINKLSHVFAISWKPTANWPVESVSGNIEQYGYSMEDFLSGKMTYRDIIFHEDIDKINSALLDIIKDEDEESFNLEYRITSSSGELHWVAERSFLTRDKKGNIVDIQGLIFDITEYKKIDFRMTEGEYSTLVEKGNEGIVIVQDEELKFVNNKFCELLDYEKNELIGGQILDHVPVEYKRVISKRYMKTLTDKMNVQRNSEVEFLTKNENTFSAEVSFSYIHYELKPAVVMTIRDISERKHAEIELRDSEKKYSTLVEKGNYMIVIVQDGNLAFSNQKFNSVTGYEKEESIGKPFSKFFSRGYRMLIGERFKGDMAKNWTAPRKYTVELFTKKSTKVDCELNLSIIEHEGKPAYMVIIRDLREQKEKERQLNEILGMQALLIDVVNDSPSIIFIWRPEENWPVEFVSDNISQLGYSAEDFVSGRMSYGDLVHPSDIENLKGEVRRSIQESKNVSYEYRIFTKSGEVRWVDEKANYKYDEKGNIEYIQGIIVDITDRKKVNDFIRIEAEIGDFFVPAGDMKSFFEQFLDFTLQINTIDCGALYIIDEQSEDLILVAHKGLSNNFVKSTRHYGSNSIIGKLLTTGYPIYKLYSEINALNKDKDLSYEGLKATAIVPIKNDNRIVAVLLLASHDVFEMPSDVRSSVETVSMQAEEFFASFQGRPKIEKTTDNSQYLIESLNDLFYVVDLEGCIVYTNQYFSYVMGYAKDELNGMSILGLYQQNRALEAASIFSDIINGKRTISDMPMESSNGKMVMLETKFSKTKWNGKDVVVCLGRESGSKVSNQNLNTAFSVR